MLTITIRALTVALAFVPLAALADGVHVLSDPTDPAASPFPSNRFTVFDATNLTLRRVTPFG